LPSAILAEVEKRLPCLDHAPQPRMWADLLVCKAIVEYSRGGDWEGALATALAIRPAIDRGVGTGHPIHDWKPPPSPASGPPVPAGVRLFVDGFVSPVEPPAEGLHLVQKTDGRFWNSVLVSGGELPQGWVTAPVDQPPRIIAFARIGAVASAFVTHQTPSDLDSQLYAPFDLRGPGGGLAGDIHATFFSPLGVLAQGSVLVHPRVPSVDGRVAAIGHWRALSVGAGVGLMTVHTWRFTPFEVDATTTSTSTTSPELTGDMDGTAVWVQYGYGTLMLRSRGELPLDATATVGAGRGAARVELGAGGALKAGDDRLRLGLMMDLRSASFTHAAVPSLDVQETHAAVLVRLDGLWGEY
ncbi:MAG: hypothetical protein KC621_13375, partial [Myxococcales bacterium]|nr:hypothetical protein [Myxococcales bacterium]